MVGESCEWEGGGGRGRGWEVEDGGGGKRGRGRGGGEKGKKREERKDEKGGEAHFGALIFGRVKEEGREIEVMLRVGLEMESNGSCRMDD